MKQSEIKIVSFWRGQRWIVMVHYILALLFFVFGFVFLLASGTPHQEIDTFIIFEVGAIASVWYDISYLNMRDAKDWTTVYIYEDKMVSYSSSFSKLVIKKLCEVDLGKTIYYEELNISGMAWDDYFEMFVISNEPIGLPSNRGKKYRFRNDYDKSKQILINTSTYIYRNRNKWIKQCEKPIWL